MCNLGEHIRCPNAAKMPTCVKSEGVLGSFGPQAEDRSRPANMSKYREEGEGGCMKKNCI
jgi:hypothetical protein